MNQRVPLPRQRWFQTLAGGLGLFILTEQAFKITGNPNYFPTVILLGALIVPVAFVAYIYERVSARDIPLSCVGICFLGGGTIGLIAAGLVEYETLRALNIGGLLAVGLIEESAKLILPTVMFIRGGYRSEGDGLLFGAASGMGFAALETMGYGLVALIKSQGNVGVLEEVLLIRGLLSPAGHAAWTGLVCAVAWRERERVGHGVLNGAVVVAFVAAVLLHALWDIVNGLGGTSAAAWIGTILGNLIIAAASMTLLIRRVREAVRRRDAQPGTAPLSP